MGHVWSVIPPLLAEVRSITVPDSKPFRTVVQDNAVGTVRLTGLLSETPGADTLVLIVHGLSGSALSPYCARAAFAAAQAGYSSLRLSLRGADYSGEDIFHGGTTQDLEAALRAPEAARYNRVLLVGYSVGGHIALRAAIDRINPRLRAICAICPPLDLQAATAAFDKPEQRHYRRYIFRDLNRAYVATAARGRAAVSPAIVCRARSCRERDAVTVVPRFRFRSVGDYYQRESVAPRLHLLHLPALLVAARHDPIVPPEAIQPGIANASPALTVAWTERGGHVYFPRCLDLRQSAPLGLESQVIGWLGEQ
jgi:predicted alpha/beta-fold hydrolase